MKASRDQLASAARVLSLEASVNAGRVPPALIALDDAEGSLRAANGGGSHSAERPDPTFGAVGKIDEAAKDRRRIEHILTQQLGLSRELSNLLASWVPDEDTQAKLRGVSLNNNDLWCPNHRRHGMSETRAPGRELCDWCDEFRRKYKMLPTAWLCDTAARRRIHSGDIAKAIKDHAAELREKRAEAKRERTAG